MLGIILIGDGTTYYFKKYSLLHVLLFKPKSLSLFIFISFLGGIFLEGTAQWLGKLWVYPYFSARVYGLAFTPGFSLYWLMIVESYLGVKVFLDYLIKGKKVVKYNFKFERSLYLNLAVIGLLIVPASIYMILLDYLKIKGYLFDINTPVPLKVNFIYIIGIFLGTWFIFEGIEYCATKTSLLKNIVHGYYTPLVAILIASLALALIMESENIGFGYWVYTNWPMEWLTIFNLPISMLLAWPLHYIGFLSLFRSFTRLESSEVWQGDLIS